MRTYQAILKAEFSKAKRKAVKILKDGYDTHDLIISIEAIRERLNQAYRPVTEKDLIQHLAIRISKNESI